MSGTKLKPGKQSLVDFTNKYPNNPEACYDFFNAKYSTGWYCEKFGSTHYRKIVRHNVTACKEGMKWNIASTTETQAQIY